MAVLVTAHIPGGTRQEAERWVQEGMNEALQKQTGLIFHADGEADGGWQIVSAWRSREDFEQFFEQEVRPSLPPNAPAPQNVVQELRNVVVGQAAWKAGAPV